MYNSSLQGDLAWYTAHLISEPSSIHFHTRNYTYNEGLVIYSITLIEIIAMIKDNDFFSSSHFILR